MIFISFSDQYYLVLHYPNKFGKEHPSFMPLKYEDGKFIQQSQTGTENIMNKIGFSSILTWQKAGFMLSLKTTIALNLFLLKEGYK